MVVVLPDRLRPNNPQVLPCFQSVRLSLRFLQIPAKMTSNMTTPALADDAEESTFSQHYRVFAIHRGADALCIETMNATDGAAAAIRAARENTNCEVICTLKTPV
jgi:hypothetical protein